MNLIYDLGFHNGDDTVFYLSKGYKVIAVEADSTWVLEGSLRFVNEILDKRLVLLHKAVAEYTGTIDFYVHPTKKDWNSCIKEVAESDGSVAMVVKVKTVTLTDLYLRYGLPDYMKVDIEGCELMVAKQVMEFHLKPQYVSFECPKKDYAGIFSYLYIAGYKSYQLRNQMNNTQCPSGLFGDCLPTDKWLSFNEALERYIKYKDLKRLDRDELGLGWLDLHARID